MKRIIIGIFILVNFTGHSQITLDFQSPVTMMDFVKLSKSKTKYFEYNYDKINTQNAFSLYNPDGSLFKTIQMPPKPDSSAEIHIFLISESLFDNDSSNIEYLVYYQWDSIRFVSEFYTQVKVIREDGSILLDEMNASIKYYYTTFYNEQNTESGPKLLLTYRFAIGTYYQTKVFTLPGQPINNIENIGNNYDNIAIYPNPNNGSFMIKINKNDKESTILDLYTSNGKLISTFKTNNDEINLNDLGLPDGMYFINNRKLNKNISKKLVIIN